MSNNSEQQERRRFKLLKNTVDGKYGHTYVWDDILQRYRHETNPRASDLHKIYVENSPEWFLELQPLIIK